jgi:hypothetical protein
MGFLPKSAVMVSHRQPLCRSNMERSSCRALMCRSCGRPDIDEQLPAMWPLLVNCLHMGQRRVGLCAKRRVLWTPQMSCCLCVNYVCVTEMCSTWNEKTGPSEAAMPSRAPYLVVFERGM